MLKISAVYFMWNPEICQDAPNWSKLVLYKKNLSEIFQPNVPHFASKHASSHSHVSFFLSQNKLTLTGNLEIKYWKNYLYGLCKLFQSTELLCRYGIYVFEVTREKQYAHWDIILYYLSQNTISKYITTLSEM